MEIDGLSERRTDLPGDGLAPVRPPAARGWLTRPELGAPGEFSCGEFSRGGFTIPELLVVLMVVALLTYLVIPNIEIVRYRMDGAARGAVAALVASQRQAVVRQHDVIVAFDEANRRLRIHQDRDNDGTIDDGEPTRIVPFDDDVVFGRGGAQLLTSPMPISFTEEQEGLRVVRFIRSGSASEEGVFYLTSARTAESWRFPHDTRAVTVDRATGRVTWYYYDTTEWKKGF